MVTSDKVFKLKNIKAMKTIKVLFLTVMIFAMTGCNIKRRQSNW
jgi:hypothetical protein